MTNPKIKILIAYSDFHNFMGALSKNNKKEYADKYNYYTHVERIHSIEWYTTLKLHLILKNLNDCDWLFWTDVDSLIWNDNFELSTLCKEDKSIIISQHDSNISPYKYQLHCGNFLIKNDDLVKHYFYKINEYVDGGFFNLAREEAYLTKLFFTDKRFREMVDIVPIKTFCSTPPEYDGYSFFPNGGFDDESFIVHFPSLFSLDYRNDLFKKYYDIKSKRHI